MVCTDQVVVYTDHDVIYKDRRYFENRVNGNYFYIRGFEGLFL